MLSRMSPVGRRRIPAFAGRRADRSEGRNANQDIPASAGSCRWIIFGNDRRFQCGSSSLMRDPSEQVETVLFANDASPLMRAVGMSLRMACHRVAAFPHMRVECRRAHHAIPAQGSSPHMREACRIVAAQWFGLWNLPALAGRTPAAQGSRRCRRVDPHIHGKEVSCLQGQANR